MIDLHVAHSNSKNVLWNTIWKRVLKCLRVEIELTPPRCERKSENLVTALSTDTGELIYTQFHPLFIYLWKLSQIDQILANDANAEHLSSTDLRCIILETYTSRFSLSIQQEIGLKYFFLVKITYVRVILD